MPQCDASAELVVDWSEGPIVCDLEAGHALPHRCLVRDTIWNNRTNEVETRSDRTATVSWGWS